MSLLRMRAGPVVTAFNTTDSIRTTERKFVDLTSMLASVPTGNKVTLTLRTKSSLTPVTLDVWQYPSVAREVSYAYEKREIAGYLTVTTSGAAQTTGSFWVECVYKNGSGETGATITYNYGFDVANNVLTWNYGAKTKARQGGPLLTQIGDGTATAITAQKDKNNNTVTAFEVFYGRIVWTSTNGTSTSYGNSRSVSTATALTQTPYSVTLDNGQTLTINAVDGQYDLAPRDPSIVTTGLSDRDQLINHLYSAQLARGEVVMLEDGSFNVGGSKITLRHDKYVTGGPTAPTAGSIWAPCDLTQAGWIQFKSRSPWGATIDNYAWEIDCAGQDGVNNSTGTYGAGTCLFRFTTLVFVRAPTFGSSANTPGNSTARRVGWVAVDHCYQNVDGTSNQGAGFFATQGDPGGRHHHFICDNWCIGNSVAIQVFAEDSEVIGNRIERAGQDAIRPGMWGTDPTNPPKLWFNFILRKYNDQVSHPDFIQFITTSTPNDAPGIGTYYPLSATPTNAATFTSTVPFPTIIGNIGIPDTNLIDGSVTGQTPGTLYYDEDGQGLFQGDQDSGRYYRLRALGEVRVQKMTNGLAWRSPSSDSIVNYVTFVDNWYNTAPLRTGLSSPRINYLDATLNSGAVSNSIFSGGAAYTTTNGGTPSGPPTQTNNDTAGIASGQAASKFVNPTYAWPNVTRMEEVVGALTTIGAAATMGAFVDKAKINHRARTFDNTLL